MAVRRVPRRELAAVAAAFAVTWPALTLLLRAVGGANPPLDALVTALSLGSQWLLNRRFIESWAGWIAADVLAVYLFWTRGLPLTAGLYAAFLAMCVAGWVEWRRHLRGADR